MEIICKRCSYKWDYKGKRTLYACCPNCKTTVKIQMFVNKEKTVIQELETKIQRFMAKFNSLADFLEEKNPALMADWAEKQSREAVKEAEELLKNA